MKRSLLIAVLMAFCYCFSPSANAQPGVLDQAFGVGGKVVTAPSFAGASEGAADVGLQRNGKIVVVGNAAMFTGRGFAVRRYEVNGKVDSSFGTNGIAGIGLNINDQTSCVAIQSDDKILLGGSTNFGFMTGETDFVIIRFTANGKIDSTFGNNGITSVDFSNSAENRDFVKNLFVRPNGKIVACGSSGDGFAGSNGFAMIQLLPNGQLDSSFGTNGQTLISSYGNPANDYALLPNGKIIGGQTWRRSFGTQSHFNVARFSLNGNLDSSFGIAGFGADSLPDFLPAASVVTKNGNILFAGNFMVNFSGISLIQYDSTGHLDYTFGDSGMAINLIRDINALNFNYGSPSQILLDPSGKLLIAGTINSKFLLARLNSNGTLDSSFGRHGIVTTDISPSSDQVNGAILQPDGKIVLAGTAYVTANTSGFAMARYEKNALIQYNTITGTLFLDYNGNNVKDNNEPFFNSAAVRTISPGIDTILTVPSNGQFLVDIDTGYYSTSIIPFTSYYTVAPLSHTTVNTTYFNTDSVSFALHPIAGKRDLSIIGIPINVAKVGIPLQQRILCKNEGTDTTNAKVEIILDSKTGFISATPTASSKSGDTLRWNLSNLKPLDIVTISVNMVISAPQLNIGDTIINSGQISSIGNEQTPVNNNIAIKQVIRASYDPNDKTENHGGKITNVQVANGDYLQYTIRFQNTGNDTAFNVYIRDTLDNKLDWNTMQILTASHNYQMTMNDGNKCLFTFRNINLVDSITNEPGSHGYIVYKVKPRSNVALGDIIKNTAAIYFDYNLPILTNTETTTIVSEALPLRLLSFSAKRDNKANLLNWITTNEINVDHFEIERSSNPNSAVGTGGWEFSKIGIVKAGNTNYTFKDNNPLQNINYYRLKMMDKDGKFEYSPIRMINNNTDGQISIYPNPSRDKVTITHPSNIGIAQLQITDINGRILRRTTVASSSVQTHMNIKGLPAGKYNITWSNGLISHTQALVIE